MLATYSASKAFLDTFSTALAEEMKKDGVLVQCLNPYFVVSYHPHFGRLPVFIVLQVSKLSKIRKPSLMIPTPAAFVRASLSKVGLSGGSRFTGKLVFYKPYCFS